LFPQLWNRIWREVWHADNGAIGSPGPGVTGAAALVQSPSAGAFAQPLIISLAREKQETPQLGRNIPQKKGMVWVRGDNGRMFQMQQDRYSFMEAGRWHRAAEKMHLW
jgi:hypothetical protein